MMCLLGRAGGGPSRIGAVTAVVDAGVAVMGHVGLLPQSISVLGGFGPQGKSAANALRVLDDAKVCADLDSHILGTPCKRRATNSFRADQMLRFLR